MGSQPRGSRRAASAQRRCRRRRLACVSGGGPKDPRSKIQDPDKHQAPNTNGGERARCAGSILVFGAYLELGVWCLVFLHGFTGKASCSSASSALFFHFWMPPDTPPSARSFSLS